MLDILENQWNPRMVVPIIINAIKSTAGQKISNYSCPCVNQASLICTCKLHISSHTLVSNIRGNAKFVFKQGIFPICGLKPDN